MAELTRLHQIWRERDRRIEFPLRPGASPPVPERRKVFVTAHVSGEAEEIIRSHEQHIRDAWKRYFWP